MFQKKKQNIENNLLFSFEGDQNTVNTSLVIQQIELLSQYKKFKKNLFHILCELTQNKIRLVDLWNNTEQNVFKFKYGSYNQIDYLYYSSKIETGKAIKFRDEIYEINKLTFSQMNKEHKSEIQNSPRNEKTSVLDAFYLKKRSKNNVHINLIELDDKSSLMELIVQFCDLSEINNRLKKELSLDKDGIFEVLNWHVDRDNDFLNYIYLVTNELSFHPELNNEKKLELLTNEEFLKSYKIRKEGLEIVPDEWIDSQSLRIDYEKLDDIWLRPCQSYLYRELNNSKDTSERLKILEQRDNFRKRGFDSSTEERKQRRLEKLQKSIDDNKVIIFLGRQNHVYNELQKKLNGQNKGQLIYISDHVWSTCGYIQPGVKSSNSRLSVIQAAETIRRLNNLGIKSETIAKREIAFSLDGYDVKHAFSAMYSNPNRIERNYGKPKIEGIDHFEFAHTGLTDLELANIVRNKDWFDLTAFYRTGKDGEPEKLTKQLVAQEYGLKFIGDLMIEKLMRRNR